MKYNSKEWLCYEDFIHKYVAQDNRYYCVEAGFRKVNPKNIIGLSRWDPITLYSDDNMKWLRQQVTNTGWDDSKGRTIYLNLASNRKYTVGSGGNHRALLSNKLDLETIMATVDILVPYSLLTTEERAKISELEIQIKEINYEKDIMRKKYPPSEIHPLHPLEQVRLYIQYGLSSVKISKNKKIEDIYKDAAIREKLVPEDYFNNLDIII